MFCLRQALARLSVSERVAERRVPAPGGGGYHRHRQLPPVLFRAALVSRTVVHVVGGVVAAVAVFK